MDDLAIAVDSTTIDGLAADYAIESEVPGATRIAPGTTLEECVRFADNLLVVRHMGSFSYLGAGSWVVNTDRIGRYCSIGQGVIVGAGPHPADWLSTSTFFYRRSMWSAHPLVKDFYQDHPVPFDAGAPGSIGNDVWIGSGAMVMMGVNIGHGAIIGANSTVTRDVPPYAVVVGSPAKVVRFRFPDKLTEALLASQWWDVHPLKLKGLDYRDIDSCLDALAALGESPDDLYRPRTLTTLDWINV